MIALTDVLRFDWLKNKERIVLLPKNRLTSLNNAIDNTFVFGMTLCQKRNDVLITKEHLQNVKTGALADSSILHMILAAVCAKHMQWNSVGFAKNGMMVGVGAGQQRHADCVKLAARKVHTWCLRQHHKVLSLPFEQGVKRQHRVNARV